MGAVSKFATVIAGLSLLGAGTATAQPALQLAGIAIVAGSVADNGQ